MGDFLCAAALEIAEHPASILLTIVLTMGVNVYLYARIPGILPQQDTGRLQGAS